MDYVGEVWWLVTCLIVSDTLLFAESEEELLYFVRVLYDVYKHGQLKVNGSKSSGFLKETVKV